MTDWTYPHMCRDGHQQIGHSDSEHEQCPLCRSVAMLLHYGEHKSNCAIMRALPTARLGAFQCTCGWDEARATFEASHCVNCGREHPDAGNAIACQGVTTEAKVTL